MEHMIRIIKNNDFTTYFRASSSNDEIDKLMVEMNDALEMFRERTHESMIEEAEAVAWQKLISVLTHEIMNSIAPIISLSETLSERETGNEDESEEYKIMMQAMEAIHRRSVGLLSFVENYRKLTRLPQPVLHPIVLKPMLTSLQQLTSSYGIAFTFDVYPEQMILKADKGMVEQLLLNLLKNAKEACEGIENSAIEVKAEKVGNSIKISVSDNGQGIVPEARDKIFIPFYSTKAKGSGIGLSLCKQIVLRHGGKMSLNSDNNLTKFIAEFPD
jgi:nitrogen fixation/metabolism regulation signal transduction histidine kinase